MTKTLPLFAIALTSTMAMAQVHPQQPNRPSPLLEKTHKSSPMKSPAKAPELDLEDNVDMRLRWNPEKVSLFTRDYSSWEREFTIDYAYNSNGEVASETYNLGEDYGNAKIRFVYAYDQSSPSLVISRESYEWNGKDFVRTYLDEYSLEITRNEAGLIQKAIEHSEDTDNTMEIEFGAENRPSKITVVENSGTPYEQTWIYSDMVWERFEGNSFVIFEDINDLINMIPGSYAIKSCNWTSGKKTGSLAVEFDESNRGSFSYVMEGTNSEERTSEKETFSATMLDENGSYHIVTREEEWMTSNPEIKETFDADITGMLEKFGLCTLYSIKEIETDVDGEKEEETINEKYTVEYGSDGYPVSLEGTKTRYEFEGVSGVEGIAYDAESNSAEEYFTFQGIRVSEPANGLYLVRKNGKTSKVFVK